MEKTKDDEEGGAPDRSYHIFHLYPVAQGPTILLNQVVRLERLDRSR